MEISHSIQHVNVSFQAFGFSAEAGHALVGALMPEYDPVAKISIVPRGGAGGLTFFAPSEERLESGLYSRSYLENQMAVALGGRYYVHFTQPIRI
jgi:ATP-dependent Zn protease